ncbi:hypothetical protein F5887DRAFT_6639 [Amanita rubescens]|nr:hypothetical protein F5887DRAFT_6639 [Amanita rubescens]
MSEARTHKLRLHVFLLFKDTTLLVITSRRRHRFESDAVLKDAHWGRLTHGPDMYSCIHPVIKAAEPHAPQRCAGESPQVLRVRIWPLNVKADMITGALGLTTRLLSFKITNNSAGNCQVTTCAARSDRDFVPRFSSKHRIWEMNARLCPTSYKPWFTEWALSSKNSLGLLCEETKTGEGYFTEVFSQAPYAGNYRRSGTSRELHTTQ